MKKQENVRRSVRLTLLALAICLAGGAGTAAANPQSDPAGLASPTAPSVETPLYLGGVPLARMLPWQPARAYTIGMITSTYAPLAYAEASALAPLDPGIDPMQTATIIPGVFGSVAITMRNFPASARWSPVYRAIRDCADGDACERDSIGFSDIIKAVKDKGFSDKLAFVNSGVNQLIGYRRDQLVYGSADHWAKPLETLQRRAGDCEDFAILKMTALMRAGIPAQSMALVVLQDTRRNVFHAVLSVSTASGNFILDSLSNKVVKDTALPDYMPLYSFSTDRAWIHGSRSGGDKVAQIKGGFASIAPGEGPQAEGPVEIASKQSALSVADNNQPL